MLQRGTSLQAAASAKLLDRFLYSRTSLAGVPHIVG
jgi:hypothetical protein